MPDGPATTELRRFVPGTSTRLPALLVLFATDLPEPVALRFLGLVDFVRFGSEHWHPLSRPGNVRLNLHTVGMVKWCFCLIVKS